jgi:hypothetical protein
MIIRNHTRTGEDIQELITAAMEAFWLQERSIHGERTARGKSLEAILPCIKEFARYYYQVIFQEMAKGDLKLLQHRFRSLVRGCEAVYRERLKMEVEPLYGKKEDVNRADAKNELICDEPER